MAKRSRYDDGSNTFLSFLAFLLLSYLVVISTLVPAAFLTGTGTLLDMILAIVDVLPFGETFLSLALTIMSSLTSSAVSSVSALYNGSLTSNSAFITNFFIELCKLLLAAGFNAALYGFLEFLLGLHEAEGIWNAAKRVLLLMLCAYLGAFLANMLLTFLGNQLAFLPGFVQNLLSGLIAFGSIGGVFAIMCILFLNGGEILTFIIYFLLRYVLFGVLRIMIAYTVTLLALLFVQSGNLLAFLLSQGSLMVILIVLVGMDLMLKSLCGFED